MAKSAAEKKAYAKEYYNEYVKKGKKKGRKKAKTKTKTSNASLLGGSSTSGLNSDGIIEASLIKEKAKAAMNFELNSAKTDEERDNIRRKYSQIANAQIEKLKTDSKYAKPKATKTTKSSKGTKTAKAAKTPKSSSSSKRSAGSSSKNTGSSKTTASTTKADSTTASALLDVNTASLDAIRDFVSNIDEIYSKMSQMTPEQKTEVRTVIQGMIDLLKKRLSNG